MMQQAPMAPKAVQAPPPGAEKGGNDAYFKTVARIPDMTDDELNSYVGSGYGALALGEIFRRNRNRLVEEAKKAGAMQGKGTIAERQMAQLMQNRMREKLAADDRFGLNNIVAQAEQGDLAFGQPTTLAGGGMVAFQEGGRSWLDELFMMAAPAPSAMVNRPPLQSQATEGPIVGRQTPKATQADVRKVDNAIDKKAAEAKPTKTEKKEAKDIVAGLKSLTAEDILKGEEALMASRGLGSFGAGVKGNIEKRAKRGEETYGRAMSSEPFLAAAQAVGGGGAKPRRMSNLEALAAAVGAGGASAAGINRERAKYQDSLDDLRDKVALQQELYDRGRVSDAMKLERTIKQEQAKLALEREKLASLAQYRRDMIQAQRGKNAGGVKPSDVVSAMKEIRELEGMLYNGANIPPEQKQAMMQRIRMLQGIAGAGVSRGMGLSIEDVAD